MSEDRLDSALDEMKQESVDAATLDAVRGFQTAITLDRPVSCDTCRGSGKKVGTVPTNCPQCGGSGSVSIGET